MSTREKMPFSTTYDTCTTAVACVPNDLFSRSVELARLNFKTYGLVLASAARHWECLLQARTLEQVVRAQADTLPTLASQIAVYTQGWIDVLTNTTVDLNRTANAGDENGAREARTLLDGIAKSARSVDAMLSAVSPAPSTSGGDVAVRSSAAAHDTASADPSRAGHPAPAVPKRRAPPRGRR